MKLNEGGNVISMDEITARHERNRRRRELALDIERQVGRIEQALDDLKSTVHDLKNEEDDSGQEDGP